MLAVAFVQLALLAEPSVARCPRTPIHVASEAHPTVPDGTHPTHDHVTVVLDLSSDGRVRRAAISESSGDPAVDRATLAASEQQRFDMPTFSCITFSTTFAERFDLPKELVPSPSPSAAPVPVCGTPFVTPSGLSPSERPPRGTASIDVDLDAAAHVDGARIVQSSGNAETDRVALAAARASGYAFIPFAGCPPAATTYRLDLTFR
ncbi:MAG TPA: energy transducer TonB [Candidatus Elarobacter sp.]|jgi:TonB family protein|nr:energy transducer TonB [Candidatus Elarobacter sp.]